MPSAASSFLRLVDETLAFLFAPDCPGCDEIAGPDGFCAVCLRFPYVQGPFCGRCGRSLSAELEKCGRCLHERSPLDAVRSALWLTESMRGALHRIKFAGQFELIARFDPVFDRFEAYFPSAPVIVPVPLHRNRLHDRGFNQSERIASRLAKNLELACLRESFEKTRATEAQSTLTRAQRLVNLRRSFEWTSRSKPPEQILLVDDVYTTGSTLEACARVLKKAGAKKVYAWTLFRAP